MAFPEQMDPFNEIECEGCRVFIERDVLKTLDLPAELEFLIPQEGVVTILLGHESTGIDVVPRSAGDPSR